MASKLDGLPGRVHVAENLHQLHDDLAVLLMGCAMRAVAERGVFHVALSGGSTPEPFYVNLVIDPRFRGIPWQHAHIWMVDERRVAEDDPRSNFRMIRQSLVDHLPMRKRQVHPMPVMLDDPATVYEQELRRTFFPESAKVKNPSPGQVLDERLPRFDFMLLGMGDDAHTASLFPHSPAIGEVRKWVAVNDGPTVVPPARVTLTYPLINNAHQVVVLCAGAKKLATLTRISEQLKKQGSDPVAMPITGVELLDGDLAWYLDPAAAGAEQAD